MPSVTSQLTVRLIDAVSAPARAVAQAIRGIGTAVDQTNARRLTVGAAIHRTARDLRNAGREFKRHADSVASAISLPVGLMAGFGANAVYQFEKMGNAVQAVTGMTDAQRESLEALAQDLNKLFPFVNKEIMGAAFELGRAGMNFEQIMGMLRSTLNLALAGDIDLQESADIATNIMTAMRLPMKTQEQAAESLIKVNDALSYVASKSNTDVRLMGETFKYVGPMAAAAGMSINEVAAASMQMAKNGIRGSEAGVAMRSALVRMVRPTKPMIGALERLNININDFVKGGRQIAAQDIVASLAADGIDARGLEAQIDQALNDPALQQSLGAMTQRLADIIGGDGSVVDKSKLAENISDALTAAGSEVDFFGFIRALREKGADLGDIARIFDARQGSRLITLLTGDLLGLLEQVNREAEGATDQMARTRMKGVVGQVAEFNAALENLFLSIAKSGVLDGATAAIKSVTSALQALSETSPDLLKWGTYGLLAIAVIGPLGILLGGLVSFFLMLGAALKIIAASTGAIAVFRAMAGAAVAASGAGAATGAAGAAAGTAGAAAAKGSLWGRIAKGVGIVGAGLAAGEVLKAIDPEGNLWGLTSGIDNWFKEKLGVDPSDITGTKDRLDRIDEKIDGLGAGGGMSDAEAPRIKSDIQGAGEAGAETMAAWRENFERESRKAEAMVDEFTRKMKSKLSFIATPSISPRIDGTSLRGVHADTGIE